jgi:succinate dehydrogenase flavin-adding protein (antitoxin of CptAB toxin-antitoxin module)
LAKLREQRLSRFRSTGFKQAQHQHLSTEDLKEADRLLDEITNDLFNTPAAAAPSNPPTFKMEEELKEDFKDIFKVTQDELLDLIDRNNQQYTHNNNLNFMDELLSQGSD